jgi:hypothetical protein
MVIGQVMDFPTRESTSGDRQESDEISLHYKGKKIGSFFFLRDENSDAIPPLVIERLQYVATCWDSDA